MEPLSPARAVSMRTLLLTCLGLLALVSLVVAIVVSQSSSSRQHRAGAGSGDNGLGGASPSASTVAVDATDGTGGTGAGNTGDGGPNATPTWTPTRTTQTGPQVVYFRFRQQPRCISPGSNLPAIIEWKVGGSATGAALSVDNPGIVGSYRTYDGTTGSETLYAGCGGAPGSTERHTYTIYTVGGSPQRSATLTATMTVPGPTPTPSPTKS